MVLRVQTLMVVVQEIVRMEVAIAYQHLRIVETIWKASNNFLSKLSIIASSLRHKEKSVTIKKVCN